MTFADFAMTEARFRKHFRMAPPDTWHEDMVPLAQFLELEPDEREGKYPYIWTVDKRQHLSRLLVDASMVKSSEERRDFWVMLKAIAGVRPPVEEPVEDLEEKARREVVSRIASGLMKLAGGGELPADLMAGTAAAPEVIASSGAAPAAASPGAATAAASGGDYMAPWLDSDECTACDECMNINGRIFAYNDQKQAIVVDPKGGSFKDIVKAAEKCTAGCIHPGTPWNPAEKDLDKLLARAAKYQ